MKIETKCVHSGYQAKNGPRRAAYIPGYNV
jgi:hypothetical protein